MSAQFQHSGSFHAADAAADDVNFLWRIRLSDVVLVCLHGLSIDGASCQMQGIGKFLIVWHALVMAHVETAVVTQDTRTDLILPVFHEFCDPGVVGKERSGKTGSVDLSFFDGFSSDFGIHASGTDDRDIAILADLDDVIEVAIFRHVDRRMRPIPGIVGAVVAVEHVVTRFFQKLDCQLGFFHVSSDFCVFFTRQSTFSEVFGLGDDRIAKGDREVVSAFFLYGFDDLGREAIAVFQGSAVFVCPLIDVFQGELV